MRFQDKVRHVGRCIYGAIALFAMVGFVKGDERAVNLIVVVALTWVTTRIVKEGADSLCALGKHDPHDDDDDHGTSGPPLAPT